MPRLWLISYLWSHYIDALPNKLNPYFIQFHCFKQKKAELDPTVISLT